MAITTAIGLASLKRGDAPSSGLVTELPLFAGLPLLNWGNLVLGGCDLRSEPLTEGAQQVLTAAGSRQTATDFAEDLAQYESNITPGIAYNGGDIVDRLAVANGANGTPRETIDRIKTDLHHFQERNALERVIVVLLASTEPMTDTEAIPAAWDALNEKLKEPRGVPIRASSLYAIAAIESKMAVVNFTPSLGSSCKAIEELAVRNQVCHAGRDGKTGETLLKTVLAPMFAQRNLEVMSWVGHNILGNADGQVLDDPSNKASKILSKDSMLKTMLPGDPQSLVSIEYVKSLGDWKTAWDHIHFRGFLGTPMTLQFTWQGCDSALAAPLVLDLVRLANHAMQNGETGVLPYLSSFFKSPMGDAPQEFAEQFGQLVAYAQAHSSTTK